MSRKRVLLPGASSQIGIFAIPRLVAAGFEVIALSRAFRPPWYPCFEFVSWESPESYRDGLIEQAQILISAGPVSLAAELISHGERFEQAVVFSSSSVESKRDSGDRKERAQMRRIAEAEARLSAACGSRGIQLLVFRPTLVYGCGMDQNVSRLAGWIRKFGFIPLAGNATGLRQPVHADDLACAAVAALARPVDRELVTPLCGGSTLSFREMVEAIFRALGKPVRTLSVPVGLLATAALVAGVIPAFRGLRPEMIRRECRDLVFDDSAAREALDYRPRPFAPESADFSLPHPDEITRLAGL